MATTITVTEDVTEVTVTETTTQLNITPQVTTVGVSAVDITAANIAQSVSLTPTGNISATNVQSAFAEIGANEDFTTTLKTKLDGIEELATADQTDAEIKTAYESNENTNAFTDNDSAKLNAIEALADVTDAANVASAGAVMDSDFTSNGFMKRTGAGEYTVDSNTYLTEYIVTESDVRAHESAIAISESQITNLQSYLTAESDPVFSAHAASGVTSTKIDQWDTAYSWGNHAEAGYLTSETSHADVVVDTDFTSAGFMKRGASSGTYEIASTIAFTDLDCVKDEDDMASDSAIHVPTQQSVKAFVEDQENIHIYVRDYPSDFSLGTSFSDIFEEFETPSYTEKRLHEIDIHLHLISGSTTAANNGTMIVEAEVPTGNTEFSLGNATRYGGGKQTYSGILQVDGDITDKISNGGSIALSTNPSGSYSARSVYGVYYDRADDKTRIEYSEYPSPLIGANDDPTELFHDPFRFNASGTFITIETVPFNVYAASQDTQQKVSVRIGYISQGFKYRVRMREQTSGQDQLSHRKVKYKLSSRKV